MGARPQYIKLAALARELEKHGLEHLVINTGQHYDYRMAGIFFHEFSLPRPKSDLEVGSGNSATMVARVLERAAPKLTKLAPDLVVVYGDTNSTLGGSLAARQRNIPLCHVEAGLRCFDLGVPEEINRVVTDRIADLHLCPTPQSVSNLKSEGIRKNVFLTGDLLYDILRLALPPKRDRELILRQFGLQAGEYLLLTLHRSETVDSREKLAQLVRMLSGLKEPTLFPLHPRTRKRFHQFRLWQRLTAIKTLKIVDPLGYRVTLTLVSSARRVLTDSGGIQRESYFLRVPVLLLREITEWVEIHKAGGSFIVGFDRRRLDQGLYHRQFRFSNRAICRVGAANRIALRIVAYLKSL